MTIQRAGVARISLGLGVLLCLLTAAGRLFDGYYRLRPWLHHPLAFMVLATAALAIAWWLAVRPAVLRWTGVVVFALLGAALVSLAWFVSVFDEGLTALSREPGPDGSMELIVYQGHDWIDPLWRLRVRTNNGVLSRERDLGCVNGDFLSLTKVGWAGPRTVRVELSNGEATDLHLDDAGRPDRTVQGGC